MPPPHTSKLTKISADHLFKDVFFYVMKDTVVPAIISDKICVKS